MNYENAVELFKNISRDSSSLDEIERLNEYILLLIEKMLDETISYEEQNLLDVYINHLRDTVTNMDIVDKYDGVVFAKNSYNMNEEKIALDKGKKKVLEMSSRGIVNTSIILETTIILGLVVSLIILAFK